MGNTKDRFSSMSDRELITVVKSIADKAQEKQAKLALYRRYDRFVHKHWHALSRQMNHSSSVRETQDDFYNESYLAFEKAVKAINLSKIEDDKWKFLGYYGFYLSNLRNGFAKKIVKNFRHETPMEIQAQSTGKSVLITDLSSNGVQQSVEDDFIEQDQTRRFWKALDHCQTQVWNDVYNGIWKLRSQGNTIKNICSQLGISTGKYNRDLKIMQKQLHKQLELTR